MAPWIAGLIGVATGIVIAFLGVAVAWGRVKQRLDSDAEKFVSLLNEVTELKRGLYKMDGTLIYVPAEDCEKRRSDCVKNNAGLMLTVCGKLDDLRIDLKAVAEKREIEAKETNDRLHQIEISMVKLSNGESIK
ncbi:MAG: hypothetical protein J7K40_15215 [candidate division Zixibacteria bacterium]|nr:hypothetical protein [candidate division Zixibacteria bacterium]